MISDQALSILVADNVEVACSAIEKAAMERAVTDVDDGFAASYEIRRRHREVSARWRGRKSTQLTFFYSFALDKSSGIQLRLQPAFQLACRIPCA